MMDRNAAKILQLKMKKNVFYGGQSQPRPTISKDFSFNYEYELLTKLL